MLRSLQFHEYEMIIAIVFLHYPDLQNRQLPPGMWFLHFGRDMAQGNQELGLPASPTGRRVRPALGRAEGKERNAQFPLSSGGSSLEEGPRLGLSVGYAYPWPPKACGCWDPTAMQPFGRSEVKASLKEVPGQLTSLCKSEGPGPAVQPKTFQTMAEHPPARLHTTSPVSSLPPPFPKFCFPRF